MRHLARGVMASYVATIGVSYRDIGNIVSGVMAAAASALNGRSQHQRRKASARSDGGS